MSNSLITTVVVVIILVVVLGGGILTIALGWNTFIPRIMPSRWRSKSKEQQNLWPSEKYPYPPRGSVETDWANSPIQSPASSPVASPRGSRQSSDLMMKTKEVV